MTSVLVAFGALLLIGIVGTVVAWVALTPTEKPKDEQLGLPLPRSERKPRNSGELLGVR